MATDASGSNVSSTIRRFSATERRLRGALLTTIRSEVSTILQVDTSVCAHLAHHPRLPTLLTDGQNRTLTVMGQPSGTALVQQKQVAYALRAFGSLGFVFQRRGFFLIC